MSIPKITTDQTLIEMANSPVPNIRAEAAYDERTGEDILSQLINDADETVRAALAERGYGIDTLVKDKSEIVRFGLALGGNCLDILMNDPNSQVRSMVASHGWRIDEMINDPAPDVRQCIAQKGYATEQYLNDPDYYVRKFALNSLFKNLSKNYEVLSCSVSEIQGEEKEAIYCEIMQKKDCSHKMGFWIDTFENGRVAVYNDEVFMDMYGYHTTEPIPETYIRQITESLEKDGAEVCATVTRAAQAKEGNDAKNLSAASKNEIAER
jgi:hypothetical protein